MLLALLLAGCSALSPGPKAASNAPILGYVGIDDTRLTIHNEGNSLWTDVTATANDTLVCKIGLVHPHDQAGINLANCTGSKPTAPISKVRVQATEGVFEAVSSQAEVAVASAGAAAVAPEIVVESTSKAAKPAAKPVTTEPVAAPVEKTPVDLGTTTTTVAAPVTPAAPTGPMELSATISGGIGPARRLTVINGNSFEWTSCVVTASDLYTYSVGMLPAGGREGIMMIKFKDAGGNLFTSSQQVTRVKVTCAQGTATATVM